MPTKADQGESDPEIERLLQDPDLAANPLLPVVRRLYLETREQRGRLDKLVRIADCFDSLIADEHNAIKDRYDRHMKRLQKITRISDLYQKDLLDLNARLHHTSRHDPLTDLPNRRYVASRLKELVSLADRKGMGFALIVLDLDHFKSINDHCGHEEGDRVLCEVAQLLLRTLRPSDIAGRWGGEEFLVVMPETTQEQATEVARRLMSELKTIKLQASGEPPVQAQVPLTVRASLGLTTHKAGESYEATLHRADDAMYRAKEQGRDRLVIL
jgi:diguanylate cyclase (GGDEF)-like protein